MNLNYQLHPFKEINVHHSPDSRGGGSADWSAPRSNTSLDASFFRRGADVEG